METVQPRQVGTEGMYECVVSASLLSGWANKDFSDFSSDKDVFEVFEINLFIRFIRMKY